MNNMEEKLWDYIDGTCSEDERLAVATLIEKDETWRKAFNDLVELNTEVTAVTLDEPPMAFSYKVMEGIRKQEAARPLKTTLNTYVIKGIAGFFVLAIIIPIVFLFTGTQTTGNGTAVINITHLSTISSEAVKIFAYFDIMLLLFLADVLLRRKRNNTVPKSV